MSFHEKTEPPKSLRTHWTNSEELRVHLNSKETVKLIKHSYTQFYRNSSQAKHNVLTESEQLLRVKYTNNNERARCLKCSQRKHIEWMKSCCGNLRLCQILYHV